MIQWSGMGMCYFPAYVLPANLTQMHTLLKKYGITRVRSNYDWLNNSGNDLVLSKAAAIQAKAEGMNVIFGICQNSTPLTAANWNDYATAVLAAAAWAQANEMDEFEVGNEAEYHNDGTTLTDEQVTINIGLLATAAQSIFTRGLVTYASGHNDFIRALYVTNGIGGLDYIAPNIYFNPSTTGYEELRAWQTSFGSQMRVREWGVDATSYSNYSDSWDVIEADTRKILLEMQRLEIESAYYFCWNDVTFGLISNSGNGVKTDAELNAYRQPWNVIATNAGRNGRSWFKSL